MDFIGMVMTGLFISFFDWVAYTLLSTSYSVFLAVSQVNIFATEGGMEIFSTVSKQIYTILGIAMVFVFAYNLILMIINPDGGGTKSATAKAQTKLVADTVFSMVLILVLPTVFNYMTVFQEHVLKNGTIPAIILGTTATTDIGDDAGNKIAMMVLTAFYHPENSTYTTFYGEDGELRDDAQSKCADENPQGSEVCTAYVDALKEFESGHKIASITGVASLREAVYKDDKGMSYMWLLSTAAALVVAWFFITYSIDIGARAVKLGFLQIIAPIPVVLKIFPNSEKSYTVWWHELRNTYIEIFVRLAVIFFMVRLIQVLPTIIGSIFDSTSGVVDSIILKCVALVLLLLGLLKFAQDAPKLFKDMFTVGGDMLKGMDFSANPKKHIESNKYGMAAMTGLAGGAAGFLGGMRNAYSQSKATHNAGTNDVQFKDYLRGGMGGLRGAVTGAVNGAKNANEHLTIDDFKKSAIRDSEYARKEYNNGNYFENVGRKIQEINADGSMNDKDKRRAYGRAIIDPYAKKGEKEATFMEQVLGKSVSSDVRQEGVQALQNIIAPVSNQATGGKAQMISQAKKSFETQLYTTGSAMQTTTVSAEPFVKRDASGAIQTDGNGKPVIDDAKFDAFFAGRKVDGADSETIKNILKNNGEFTGSIELRRNETSLVGKALLEDAMEDYQKEYNKAMASELNKAQSEVVKSIATFAKAQSERSAQIGKENIDAINGAIAKVVGDAEKAGVDVSKYKGISNVDQFAKLLESNMKSGVEISDIDAQIIQQIKSNADIANRSSQFKPKDVK